MVRPGTTPQALGGVRDGAADDFLHDWAADKINDLRQERDSARQEASDWKDRSWELECALRDLLRDESERRAIGGGPDWKTRHAASWTAAFDIFDGEPL